MSFISKKYYTVDEIIKLKQVKKITEMLNNEEYSRLFIATFFEDAAENLVKPLQRLDEETSANIRKVSPEKIHLTWKFLGNFPSSNISNLVNEVDAAAKTIKQTCINMTEISIWPNRRRPKQIVITTREDNQIVNSFFNTLEKNLYKLDIEKESRNFNPHITIARFKKNIKGNQLLLQPLEKFSPQNLCINNINIVQSNLNASGAEYKVLYKINLLHTI